MKLPEKVIVGYRTYRLESLPVEEAKEVWGWHREHSHTIQVQTEDIRPAQLASTLIHEILHACYSVSDLTLGKQPEEKVVTMLAHQITQVWRDNPEVIAFIQHNIKKGTKCGSISTSKPTTSSTKSLASGASAPLTSTPTKSGRSGRVRYKTA